VQGANRDLWSNGALLAASCNLQFPKLTDELRTDAVPLSSSYPRLKSVDTKPRVRRGHALEISPAMPSPARPSTPPAPAALTHTAPSPAPSPLAKRPKPSPSTSASVPRANPASAAMATQNGPPPTTSIETCPPLLIKKLKPNARAPTRGSAFAAGYDLYSAHDTVIPARGKALVDTELAIAVPAGTCECFTGRPPPGIDSPGPRAPIGLVTGKRGEDRLGGGKNGGAKC
jgi:hypothetical protein